MAAREKKTATTRTTAKAETKPKATTTRRTTRQKAVPAISEEMIAERAYWISQSPECSNDVDNWLRAEAELRPA